MGKCHFIGIGGIGMSGLARILLTKKENVTGSDLVSSYIIEGLEQAGAKVFQGHSATHISPDMTVVYTSDIKQDNPEYQAALDLKCPMLHRSDLLLQLMSGYKTLAVTGTHGKTTTSALLATVLVESGFKPSYAVGGIIPQLESNAGYGEGEYFVAEADESDGTFLKYKPWGGIVTNIDNDHLEYYKEEDAIDEAFKTFIHNVESEQHLFLCGDDLRVLKIHPKGIKYGFNANNDLVISNLRQKDWRIVFDIEFNQKKYEDVEVPLLGQHNALNAAAVFGLCLNCGISEQQIRHAFLKFKGIKRRCECKSQEKGVIVLDDYAHHPKEVGATLQAIRNTIEEKRLIALFQPHRYTRTKECEGNWGKCFDAADLLIITDIYGAGENPIEGVTTKLILDEVRDGSRVEVLYLPKEELLFYLKEILRPHDVVITLGAGDITKIGTELASFLKNNPIQKYKIGVIDGGRSYEHEVSKVSARNIFKNFNRDYYEVIPFHISRKGEWVSRGESVRKSGDALDFSTLSRINECDLFFPVLHGRFGEDGTIQGFFDILNKPYIGCDHRSAAIAMDKALTKHLMVINGIPTLPYIDFSHDQWKKMSAMLLEQIKEQLVFPIFVKPVHLGSSIGVTKVEDFSSLSEAIEEVFTLDNHIIVENGVRAREIEFAVCGNRWITVFPPGEICSNGEKYDFEGKYSDNGTETKAKADLPQELIEEGRFLAETAYKAIGCTGMARVDFFLDSNNKFWLNEINPIPGFTPNSLYPAICHENGLSYPALLDRLVISAMERVRQLARIE